METARGIGITIDDIINAACDYFDIPFPLFFKKCREKEVPYARQTVCHLSLLAGYKHSEIAEGLALDRSTVYAGDRVIKYGKARYPVIKNDCENIGKLIIADKFHWGKKI